MFHANTLRIRASILVLCHVIVCFGYPCKLGVHFPYIDVNATLNHINAIRRIHSAANVTWSGIDSTMHAHCITWAATLAQYSLWQHSHYSHGENLAMLHANLARADLGTYSIVAAIDMWYDEVKAYDFRIPIWSPSTGHFTQIVWKRTSSIAFCASYCLDNNKVYVVMMFDPPGNYANMMKDNVLPASLPQQSQILHRRPPSPRIRRPPPPPPPPFYPPPPTLAPVYP